jgi:hypothetical protein
MVWEVECLTRPTKPWRPYFAWSLFLAYFRYLMTLRVKETLSKNVSEMMLDGSFGDPTMLPCLDPRWLLSPEAERACDEVIHEVAGDFRVHCGEDLKTTMRDSMCVRRQTTTPTSSFYNLESLLRTWTREVRSTKRCVPLEFELTAVRATYGTSETRTMTAMPWTSSFGSKRRTAESHRRGHEATGSVARHYRSCRWVLTLG